jgi:glycosyltransferase involved in cell wall biosynthesis
MTERPIAIAFVGAMAPPGQDARFPAASPAGSHFQHEVLRTLAAEGLPVDTAFLLRPVASFPADRRLFFGRATGRSQQERFVWLPYINVRLAKTVSAGIAVFVELVAWAWRCSGRPRLLLTYNVVNPAGWPVLLAARLTRSRIVAIIADVVLPGESGRQNSLMRRIEYRSQRRVMPRHDGIVAVTPRTIRDFVPDTRALVLDGCVPADLIPSRGRRKHGNTEDEEGRHRTVGWRILYSGRLTETQGVDLLLAAFLRISDPNWVLTITGWGAAAERVRLAAERDKRIRFLGLVPRQRLLNEYRAADVLVNPNLTSSQSASYLFPSKLAEYLATGRPVITTAAEWLNADYRRHSFVLADETPEALAALLQHVAGLPAGERERKAAGARTWVTSARSWDTQGHRLAEFLRQVAGSPRREFETVSAAAE